MKPLTIALVAGGLFFGQPVWADDEGELLNKNGGFEEGKALYHIVRPEACTMEADDVYRGQFAMRIAGLDEKDDSKADPMVVAGYKLGGVNSEFIFRCAIKTENVDPAHPPKIQLVIDKGEGMNATLPESAELVFDRDMDWTPYEVKVSGLPESAASIGFWIRVPRETQSVLLIDEIEVREIVR